MALEFDEEGRVIVPKGITKEKDLDSDNIILRIRGVDFFFDSEGKKFFEDIFDIKGQAYVSDKGYLVKKDNGKRQFFHRIIMEKEIQDFCVENDCEPKDVEVHHLNNNKDNRKENLICLDKREHSETHKEERAWVHYRKRMSQFWREGKGEDYYRKKFHNWWLITSRNGAHRSVSWKV